MTDLDYYTDDPDRMCKCGHPHRDHRQCPACVFGDWSEQGAEFGHFDEACNECDCPKSDPAA